MQLLAIYDPGVQQYGKEYFTNLDEILKYFDMNVLESAHIKTNRSWDAQSQGTFFVAKIL
jgi:hypothetical protein